MHDARGAPADAGDPAVVTIPSIRQLFEEHCERDRAELLTEIDRGDRIYVTIRPLAAAAERAPVTDGSSSA